MKKGVFTRMDERDIKRLRKEAKRLNVAISDLIGMAVKEILPSIEESKELHLKRDD